jgi:hypothetical protein
VFFIEKLTDVRILLEPATEEFGILGIPKHLVAKPRENTICFCFRWSIIHEGILILHSLG